MLDFKSCYRHSVQSLDQVDFGLILGDIPSTNMLFTKKKNNENYLYD